jgi:hypothetical protein
MLVPVVCRIRSEVSVSQLDEESCEAHIPQRELSAFSVPARCLKTLPTIQLRVQAACKPNRAGDVPFLVANMVEVFRLLPAVTAEPCWTGGGLNSTTDLKTTQNAQLVARSRSPWLFQLDEAVLAGSGCPIRHNITAISSYLPKPPHTLKTLGSVREILIAVGVA